MADTGITLEQRTGDLTPRAVEEGDLVLPGAGGGSATLRLSDPEQPVVKGWLVRLRWYGQEILGCVDDISVAEGKTTAFVVLGNGKLSAEVPAKHYQSASAALLLQEACAAAGEQYATDRLPQGRLSQFARQRAPLSTVLDDIARAFGCGWGVYLDGRIWLGTPPWSAAPAFDADKLDEDTIYQTSEFVPRGFGPVPGQTWDGRRVFTARYTTHPENGPRLRLWYGEGDPGLEGDALRAGIAQIVRETVPLVWLGKYQGALRAVRSNGTWDVQLDEKRLPPMAGVRPRVFAPGAKIVPPLGSRVDVSFEQADPRYPVAELFEPGSATRGAARFGDETKATDAFFAWIGQVQTTINSLAPGAVAPLLLVTQPLTTITSASDVVKLP